MLEIDRDCSEIIGLSWWCALLSVIEDLADESWMVMLAMIRSCPPQRGQSVTSISNSCGHITPSPSKIDQAIAIRLN
jgi:hypothetical protein